MQYRYSLRRQSVRLKDEKPETTEDLVELVEIKDDISNLQENLAKESGTTSLGSKAPYEARETTECNCTQLVHLSYFLAILPYRALCIIFFACSFKTY